MWLPRSAFCQRGRHRCGWLKSLESGGGWSLRVGINNLSALM
jgi:hypothetical protein